MGTDGLRPLSVGEILDAAIKLYSRNARVLMGAVAVIVVPLQLVQSALLISTYTDGRDISTGFANIGTHYTQTELNARLGASAISSIVTLISISLILAISVKALSDAYLGQEPGIEVSVRFALRRMLPLLGLELLYFLGLLLCFILLVIPGIYMYAAWSVAVPALLIERRSPSRALGRSRELVKGRWWPTAGVLLVAELMAALVSTVIVGALTAIALTSSHPSVVFAVAITTLATIVSSIVVQPFSAAVSTVLYYDLRIRREGYDLELMAEQLGLSAAALPSPGWQTPG